MKKNRPKGLKYKIKVVNKGWLKNGHTLNLGRKLSENHKKKISISHKGLHLSPATEFTREKTLAEKNNKWKGDNVGYYALHGWVYRTLGKPEKCKQCSSIIKVQWANKSRTYKRDKNDWISLCFQCHRKYDSGKYWGSIKKKYEMFGNRIGRVHSK